jgi:hypothetical protein
MATTTVAINLEAKTKGTDSVKSLKAQIREATQEATALAQKFGEFSPEATAAAKRVAELKDEMQDFQQRVQALNPDKFERVAILTKGIANGFQAAQGALALFGAESEDVQKALLRVQGAMAFAQGIQGLIDMRNQFKSLGTDAVEVINKIMVRLGATGFGLLVIAIGAGISAIISNWDKLKKAISGNDVQDALNATYKAYSDGAKEAIIKTNEVEIAFKQAREGVISKEEALRVYNEQLGDVLGTQTNLNDAEKVFINNSGAYVEAAAKRKQIDELITKAAEIEAEARIEAMSLETGFFSDQGSKQLNESYLRRARQRIIAKGKEDAEVYKKAAQGLANEVALLQKNNNIKLNENKNANAQKNADNVNAEKINLDEIRKIRGEAARQLALQEAESERERELMKFDFATADKESAIQIEIDKLKAKKKLNNDETKALQLFEDALTDVTEERRLERIALIKNLDAKELAEKKKSDAEYQTWLEQQHNKEIDGLNNFYKKQEAALYEKNLTTEQLNAVAADLEVKRLQEEIRIRKQAGEKVEALELELAKKLQAIEEKKADDVKKAEEAKQQARLKILESASSIFGSLAELSEQNETAQKAFGLAQIATDTAIALSNAQASAMSPASPDNAATGGLAGIAKYATYVAIILANAARARAILKGGGGGASGGAAAVGSAPTPAVPLTGGALPEEGQFGGMGRVYVLEGDITKTQTRVRRLRNTSVV